MNTSSTRTNIGLLFLGVSIALGLIISVILGGDVFKEVRSLNQKMTVKGYAEINVLSDIGVLQGTLKTSHVDLRTAISEIESHKNKLLSYLKKHQIPEQALDISSPFIMTINKMINGQYTNELDHFDVEMTLRVELKDVDKVKKLNTIIANDLIHEGILYMPREPEYFYSQLEQIKLDLLGKAVENAKERAKIIARASESNVGNLLRVSQGIFQITPKLSTEVSDYGVSDTRNILKTAKIVVSADFAMSH